MTSKSLLEINLLSPVLFYQNPVDIYQTQMGSTQVDGTPCEYGSCRGFNNNLANDNPASQYQRQKLIQNTVRVQSSLYTMNLAGLSSYQKPLNKPQIIEQSGTQYIAPAKVYWNQMSDRARPSVQNSKIASGSTYHSSSTRHTITRNRPGAMSPGGIGVDIKHNSYDRYLNKIKGKGPLKRGFIPPNYGVPIPFNRSYPIYGGKIVKTGIINGCNCPDSDGDKYIYNSELNNIYDNILSIKYNFNIGDTVWAKLSATDAQLSKGEIIGKNVSNNIFNVKFENNLVREIPYCDLIINFVKKDCSSKLSITELLLSRISGEKDISTQPTSVEDIYCKLENILAAQGIL